MTHTAIETAQKQGPLVRGTLIRSVVVGARDFIPQIGPATKGDIQSLRKFWHIGMMIFMAYLYAFVYPEREKALFLITVIGGPVVFFDILRLKWRPLNRLVMSVFGPLMRKRELGTVSSMTYFIFAFFIVVALFPKPVAILSILCLAFGDAAACIIGLRFGTESVIKGKSLQGSLACFVVCSILIFVGLTLYGVTSNALPYISVAGGLAATFAELFATKKIDDNLTIPLATAMVIYPLLLLFS